MLSGYPGHVVYSVPIRYFLTAALLPRSRGVQCASTGQDGLAVLTLLLPMEDRAQFHAESNWTILIGSVPGYRGWVGYRGIVPTIQCAMKASPGMFTIRNRSLGGCHLRCCHGVTPQLPVSISHAPYTSQFTTLLLIVLVCNHLVGSDPLQRWLTAIPPWWDLIVALMWPTWPSL